MSTTTNLALNEPAYNSTSPTWDQPLNYNATILDQMFGNTTSVSVNTGGSTTYTNIAAPSATAAGSTSQAMRFNLTGALGANQNVLLPQSVAGMWVVTNSTSGAYTVLLGSNNGSNVAAGTTVSCPQGYSILVYCDGTNVKKADDGLLSSGIVSSFNAGTTGFTPSSASTGAVTLSGTLNVANGGTSSASLAANNVLLGNGTSALQVVAPGTSGNVLTSNGTTWISQSVNVIGTSLNNLTGSRALNSTYTNSLSYAIYISIITYGVNSVTLSVAGNSVSSFSTGSSYTGNKTVSGIVPSGSTYSVSSSDSLVSWIEYR